MAFYMDSSAVITLSLEEQHTSAIGTWIQALGPSMVVSDLGKTESVRVARQVSPDAVIRVQHNLGSMARIRLTPAMFERAAELDPVRLRSLDALHLAAALSLNDALEGFVTYDRRLADACAQHGVDVVSPGA